MILDLSSGFELVGSPVCPVVSVSTPHSFLHAAQSGGSVVAASPPCSYGLVSPTRRVGVLLGVDSSSLGGSEEPSGLYNRFFCNEPDIDLCVSLVPGSMSSLLASDCSSPDPEEPSDGVPVASERGLWPNHAWLARRRVKFGIGDGLSRAALKVELDRLEGEFISRTLPTPYPDTFIARRDRKRALIRLRRFYIEYLVYSSSCLESRDG